MIIMNLEVDNFYCFDNFKINFSYPKKIVNTPIEYEYLQDRPNFRFKRINVIMGANASGKTMLGKMIKHILDFVIHKNPLSLLNSINNKEKNAYFSIELVSEENKEYCLYKISCVVCNGQIDYLGVEKSEILRNDSYEKVKTKFKLMCSNFPNGKPYNDSYLFVLDEISNIVLKGLFVFPEEVDKVLKFELKDEKVLSKILKTFDTAIKDVQKSKEVANLYHIIFKNGKTLSIQSGIPMEKNFLSTGTEKAIFIAYIIEEMLNRNGTFYIDEQFSYVQSELEIALLSLMITILKPKSQLFFTTHNVDVLEMELPLHSYMLLKKNDKIEVINPSDFIKKNDRSLLNAVRNDVFTTLPNTDLLNEIAESDANEQ